MQFEYSIKFGREAKRADIVVVSDKDLNHCNISAEIKKAGLFIPCFITIVLSFYSSNNVFTGSLPINSNAGFSNSSFTRTKKLTLSLPSIIL